MHLHVINGPNLNLVGIRQPEIYGSMSMEEIIGDLKTKFSKHTIDYFQSNHEGAIIDQLHAVGFLSDGIILNAGGYTHTSIAMGDAVKSITSPVLELHISDIYKRESFRQVSFIKENSIHQIVGEGVAGYEKAIKYFLERP